MKKLLFIILFASVVFGLLYSVQTSAVVKKPIKTVPKIIPKKITKNFGAIGDYVDYKIWYIRRTDDVHIDQATAKFSLGAFIVVNQLSATGTLISYTKYNLLQRLSSFPPSFNNTSTDSNGNVVKVYTSDDFGTITTDDELRLFLNGELAKVATFMSAQPVPQQASTTIATTTLPASFIFTQVGMSTISSQRSK